MLAILYWAALLVLLSLLLAAAYVLLAIRRDQIAEPAAQERIMFALSFEPRSGRWLHNYLKECKIRISVVGFYFLMNELERVGVVCHMDTHCWIDGTQYKERWYTLREDEYENKEDQTDKESNLPRGS